MESKYLVGAVIAIASAASVVGCSSSRDVEVSGDVSSSISVGAPINVEFFDVSGTGTDATQTSVHKIVLAAPGSFKETVPLEGDHLLVRAIEDRDGDGACTAGEPWAELQVGIAADNTVAPINLDLAAAPCPAAGK